MMGCVRPDQHNTALWRRGAQEGAGWFDQAKLVEVGFDCRLPPFFAVDVAQDRATLRKRQAGGTKLLYVPLPYSRVFDSIKKEPTLAHFPQARAQPRYRVTLCYGTTHEPWIRDCRRLGPAR